MVYFMLHSFHVSLPCQSLVKEDAERAIGIYAHITTYAPVHGLEVNKVINALDGSSQSVFVSFNFISCKATSSMADAGASTAASNRMRISGLSNASRLAWIPSSVS